MMIIVMTAMMSSVTMRNVITDMTWMAHGDIESSMFMKRVPNKMFSWMLFLFVKLLTGHNVCDDAEHHHWYRNNHHHHYH
jgi:hypothetical protein